MRASCARLGGDNSNPSSTRHLKQGLLWFIGGCAFTFLTYSLAAVRARGGGLYLVASGAILFGLLQFLYGIVLCALDVVNKYRSQNPRPIKSSKKPADPRSDPLNRWEALLKFDDDIAKAAEKLRPFGDKWIVEMGRAFFALNENKNYLQSIVTKLLAQATAEKAQQWSNQFRITRDGDECAEDCLDILRRAECEGYVLTIGSDGTFVATKMTEGSRHRTLAVYLRSNYEIRRFGEHLTGALQR